MLLAEPRCYLNQPEYVELFKTLVNRYDIAEYYLVDGRGSFLLVDNTGDTFFLVIKDKEDLDYYASVCDDAGAPDDINALVTSRESIPFFFTEKDNERPPSKWRGYLHPAEKLNDNLYLRVYQSHKDLRC